MKEKQKKRSSKNLKVHTRIVLSSVLAIIIPLLIILLFSTIFYRMLPSYFNLSAVTTNTYSAVNQLQWSQTLSGLSNELTEDIDEAQKKKNVAAFVNPIEDLGSLICIEYGGEIFYATKGSDEIRAKATKLAPGNDQKNLNYFGSDGLLIINHIQKDENSPKYKIIIINDNYIVNDASQKIGISDLTKLLLGRTGLIVLVIVMLFVTAISIISFITTQTIVKPIKEISHGADEIARGNLDYEIKYKSTNELGKTVESFNEMKRKLRDLIERQQKAEEERKILVAGIAHDLRTPLTCVKGYAEGLADGIADTPEKQKKYVKTICESISNTEKILDDLLTVSKLQLSGYELNKTDVSVNEFFGDGAEEIRMILEREDFDFFYENKCDAGTYIFIDIDRFSRVINNIISNSIKYKRTDIKGRVDIAIDEYERSVIIEISDNGIGVENSSLTKIFDAMYRTDPARTQVSQGSGLGLAVCKQIVELHSGSIWARNSKGGGLSIFISLPKQQFFDKDLDFKTIDQEKEGVKNE